MTTYEVRYKIGSDDLKSAGYFKDSTSAKQIARTICLSGTLNDTDVITYIIERKC